MKKIVFTWLIFAIILGACAPGDTIATPVGGVRAWIDNPREGEQFLLGETVPLRWHASAPEGIQMVEVRINAETFTLAADFDHAANLVTQQHSWTPSSPGDYLLEVIATSNSGAVSRPSANIITILSSVPTTPFTQPPILTPTATDTQPPPLTPSGTPTQQPSPTDTLRPPTWTFTPVVITPSPTYTKPPKPPTPDTFGPPKPKVIAPKDNVIVDCPGEVLLQWEAPNDPSGIASYQIELFISHDSGASWQLVKKWGAITAKELDVNKETDCGNMYAWKISARDGAGNLGAYKLVQFRTGME